MARVGAGDCVLIMGAGGNLGTLGVQIAKSLGATVIAAAGSAKRARVGLDLGADHAIDYRARDLTEEVMRITNGRGVDVVYDNIADPETCPKAIASLAQHGRFVTAGAHGGPPVRVRNEINQSISLRDGRGSAPSNPARGQRPLDPINGFQRPSAFGGVKGQSPLLLIQD